MSAEYKREWYLKNKERLAAKNRAWYLANRERILAREAERYQNNKEDKITMSARAEYKRQWRLKNKERLAAEKREWYLANKEYASATAHERYLKNKEAIKARVKTYSKSHGAIKKKLRRHKEEDDEKGRDNDLTYDYVIDLLQQQDNECAHCNTKVKLSWTKAYDPGQFSINRIKNKYGHIEGNVEICCLQCNREYKH